MKEVIRRSPGLLVGSAFATVFLVAFASIFLFFRAAPYGIAADGSGTMTVAPDTVTAGSTGNTLTFTFTAEETMDSGGVSLVVPSGWTVPQGTAGAAGYTTAASTDGMVATVEDAADALDGWAAGPACAAGIAADESVSHEGSAAIRCDTKDPSTGDVWYRNVPLGPEDWSGYAEVGFWIRSSVKFESGALVFAYGERTDLGSQIERLPFPDSVLADTWTYVNLRFASHPGDRRSVRSYGFMIMDDKALDEASVWMDDLLIGPGVPTFPALTAARVRLLRLGRGQTMTIVYGAGGGASGATAPATPGTSTFTTRSRSSDSGRLTAIAVSPTVRVVAAGATRFVIVDPTDGTAGVPVPVTVRALDADGVVDASYQRDVTLATDGSATGGGLVDVVNGVGTASVVDTVAETVHLSLVDTEGTGLDVSSTQDLAFASAPEPIRPGQSTSETLVPSDVEMAFEEGTCTTSTAATLYIHAHNTGLYRVGASADLSGVAWKTFPGTSVREPIALTADGPHPIFVQLRSPAGLDSAVLEVDIARDQAKGCAVPPHEHEIEGGHLVVPGTEPGCVADFAHASVVPYVTLPDGTTVRPGGSAAVRVDRSVPDETTYLFALGEGLGEAAIHVEGVAPKVFAHFLSTTATGAFAVRAQVLAGDLVVDDIALWNHDGVTTDGAVSLDLDSYKQICAAASSPHPHPGDVVRSPTSPVSYIATDFKRHVFPDDATYASWFDDQPVEEWPTYALERHPLGENVTLKPQESVLQVRTLTAYYLEETHAALRRFADESVIPALFGPLWLQTSLRILGEAFLPDYAIGPPITGTGQIAPVPPDLTIDAMLGLPPVSSLVEEPLTETGPEATSTVPAAP